MTNADDTLRTRVGELASFDDVVEIVKADVIGTTDVPERQSVESVDELERMFSELGAIPPPYDPEVLCAIFENSDALRPNVDAYVANIDSHGHRFEPEIDFTAEDAAEKVAMAIRMERLWLRAHGRLDADASVNPTDEEVAETLTLLRDEAEIERLRLETWADVCCLDSSMVEVRRRARMDLETHGNAYLEILRNADGDPFFVYVPGFSVRLLPLTSEAMEIEMPVRVGGIFFHTMRCKKRFRRYVQIIDDRDAVFFKELGDPRVVSRTSGEVFDSVELLKQANPDDEPATEMLHLSIHSPRSAYGIPRWIGALLEVLGNRKASEVNFLYFDNKSVPPMALLVSGGRVNKDSIPRIEDFVENHLRGRKNFHKILIIEAEATRGSNDPQHSGRMRLEFVPLTSAQQQDALFRAYSSENRDIVGASFRLPRITRGDIRDFNRACYSSDTETLTDTGWKRVDAIQPGDRIAAYCERDGSIRFCQPADLYDAEIDEPMFHYQNSQADTLVTDDHRMHVRPAGAGAWTTIRAGELTQKRYEFRVAAKPLSWEADIDRFWPRPPEIARGHEGDWLECLVYLLADGVESKTDGHAHRCLRIAPRSPRCHDALAALLGQMGVKHSAQTHPRLVFVFDTQVRGWVARCCQSKDGMARLPWTYLRLEHSAIARIFAGFRSLAEARPGRPFRLALRSHLLADQLQQLCIQLGWRCVLDRQGEVTVARFARRQSVTVRSDHDQRVVPYSGRVYCFSVPPHGLYVTRRNGKAVIHGNTAISALQFAEGQVFQPLREAFDFTMNRRIFGPMKIRFHRFISRSPITRDPDVMSQIIERLVKANVLTPQEGRRLAGDVFNREFRDLREAWVKQPLALTLAGFPAAGSDASQKKNDLSTADLATGGLLQPAQGTPCPDDDEEAGFCRTPPAVDGDDDDARRLRGLRAAQLEREVVKVPAEELASWFERTEP